MYLQVTSISGVASSWNDEVGAKVTRRAFNAVNEYNDALNQVTNALANIKLPEKGSYQYTPFGDVVNSYWING